MKHKTTRSGGFFNSEQYKSKTPNVQPLADVVVGILESIQYPVQNPNNPKPLS